MHWPGADKSFPNGLHGNLSCRSCQNHRSIQEDQSTSRVFGKRDDDRVAS